MRKFISVWLGILLIRPSVSVATITRNTDAKRASNGTRYSTLAGLTGVDQTFDYVVVGAGAGGLVMAERLSEDPTINVAVVEAGTFYEVTDPVLASTPFGDVVFVGSSIVDSDPLADWEFVTVPQQGAGDRAIHYCRGKALGGSTARNFMIYQRGSAGSYQEWADSIGDQSYTFDNLLPYMKKSIQFTPPNTSKRQANATATYDENAYSSAGGPMHVSYANYAQTFSTYLTGAFNEIGMPTAKDFNTGKLDGCQYCASTIDPSNAKRASTEETFLRAAMNRPNLKVFDLTMGKRILFDSRKKAIGVQVSSAGVPYILSARQEVIVSAGAFQSPQLLMVSGIGPRATLSNLGIPVIVDNPNVGQNMQDHVFAGPSYRVNLETLTKVANDPVYVAEQLIGPYSMNQSGILSNPVSDFLGWEKVPSQLRANFTSSAQAQLSQFPADWPEIEYISGAGYVGDFSSLFLGQPKDGYQYASILATLVAPLSRGNVTIISADTGILPVINPNWLTSTTDQQVAIAAYKRARRVFASSFMQQVVIGDEYFPGKDIQSDSEILKVWQDTLMTVWHASCTCKMGHPDDPTAVIDSRARVYGVTGLRVVDASSFALLPPGHPQSTIFALAEKIADHIKAGN